MALVFDLFDTSKIVTNPPKPWSNSLLLQVFLKKLSQNCHCPRIVDRKKF
jgi:hypothetical protein